MTELNLKRAVISCLDSIGSDANRLEIEDVVAKAGDNAPVDDVAIRLLRKGMYVRVYVSAFLFSAVSVYFMPPSKCRLPMVFILSYEYFHRLVQSDQRTGWNDQVRARKGKKVGWVVCDRHF